MPKKNPHTPDPGPCTPGTIPPRTRPAPGPCPSTRPPATPSGTRNTRRTSSPSRSPDSSIPAWATPTVDVLEKRLAALTGGSASVAVASGMAAVFYAVASLAGNGDNIVSGSNLYGGTTTLFAQTLKRFGVEARFVDLLGPGQLHSGHG